MDCRFKFSYQTCVSEFETYIFEFGMYVPNNVAPKLSLPTAHHRLRVTDYIFLKMIMSRVLSLECLVKTTTQKAALIWLHYPFFIYAVDITSFCNEGVYCFRIAFFSCLVQGSPLIERNKYDRIIKYFRFAGRLCSCSVSVQHLHPAERGSSEHRCQGQPS